MDQDIQVSDNKIEEQPQTRTVKLEDVLKQSMQSHHELMQVVAELFNRSERAEVLYNEFKKYEGFSNVVKRMRND